MLLILFIVGILGLINQFFSPDDPSPEAKASLPLYDRSYTREKETTKSSLPTLSRPEPTISVSPPAFGTTLPSTQKTFSLNNGQYRVFANYYIGGQQYTFGWPIPHCSDQRVWVGINGRETDRISEREAHRRIQQGSISAHSSERRSCLGHSTNSLPF